MPSMVLTWVIRLGNEGSSSSFLITRTLMALFESILWEQTKNRACIVYHDLTMEMYISLRTLRETPLLLTYCKGLQNSKQRSLFY